MPAPAVIPAPRVYTKVVAVKKLVVNFGDFFDFNICIPYIGIKRK